MSIPSVSFVYVEMHTPLTNQTARCSFTLPSAVQVKTSCTMRSPSMRFRHFAWAEGAHARQPRTDTQRKIGILVGGLGCGIDDASSFQFSKGEGSIQRSLFVGQNIGIAVGQQSPVPKNFLVIRSGALF